MRLFGSILWPVLLAGLSGQLRKVEALSAERQAELGVSQTRDADGRVLVLSWGGREFPLERPVRDCAVGRISDQRLVVLAGGIRDALDLYVIDKSGARKRYATVAGRRLPATFNGGRGSWPSVEGDHLVLFAFVEKRAPQFRALDLRGKLAQVLGSRGLPQDIRRFVASVDRDGGVEVRFEGSGKTVEPLAFSHPLAPRLEITPSLLVDFEDVALGSSTLRLLTVRNTGARPLRFRVTGLPKTFVLAKQEFAAVPPGGQTRLQVRFAPRELKRFDERIELQSNGFERRHTIVVRGRGVPRAKVAAPQKADAKSTATGDGKSVTKKDGVPTTPRAKEPRVPPAPRIREVRMHPLGGGEVLVLGRLETVVVERVQLDAGRARKTLYVAGNGEFHTRIQVAPGAKLQVAALGRSGARSPAVAFGVAPAMLRLAKGRAIVRGLPAQTVLVVAHAEGAVLRAWRTRLDSAGQGDFDLDVLGAGKGVVELTIVTELDGKLRWSRTVKVGTDKR